MRAALLICAVAPSLAACTLLFPFESSSDEDDTCFMGPTEAEPNDAPGSAMPLCLGARIEGTFRAVGEEVAADEDWYVVEVGAHQGVSFETDDPEGRDCQEGNDTVVLRYAETRDPPGTIVFGGGGCAGGVCGQELGQEDCNDNTDLDATDCGRLDHQPTADERVFFRVVEYCGRPAVYGLSVNAVP